MTLATHSGNYRCDHGDRGDYQGHFSDRLVSSIRQVLAGSQGSVGACGLATRHWSE